MIDTSLSDMSSVSPPRAAENIWQQYGKDTPEVFKKSRTFLCPFDRLRAGKGSVITIFTKHAEKGFHGLSSWNLL